MNFLKNKITVRVLTFSVIIIFAFLLVPANFIEGKVLESENTIGAELDKAASMVEVIVKPTIDTDKDDYVPGDIVNVTGSGWLPGETVKLYFVVLPIQFSTTYYAVADVKGNIINNNYHIFSYHLDKTIILTAKGETSGKTTSAVFTDAGISIDTMTVSSSEDFVLAGKTATYTVRLNPSNGWKSFSTNLSITTSLPAGCSASFSPNSVEWASWDYYGWPKTATLTISTSASTPVGSTTFTIAESTSGKTCTGTLVVQISSHFVNFATRRLPDGVPVAVNYSRTELNGNISTGTVSFISPGPSTMVEAKPGTLFNYTFPSDSTSGGVTYHFWEDFAYGNPFITGASDGSTTITGNYEPPKNTVIFHAIGIPSGAFVNVEYSKTDPWGVTGSENRTFSSFFPLRVETKPGTLFNYTFPSDLTSGGGIIYHLNIVSSASPITTGADKGQTDIYANYIAASHNVNIAITGLPSGVPFNVNFRKTSPDGIESTNNVATFNSPGPSTSFKTRPGTFFYCTFPGYVDYGGVSYFLSSVSPGSPLADIYNLNAIVTGIDGGSTTITGHYSIYDSSSTVLYIPSVTITYGENNIVLNARLIDAMNFSGISNAMVEFYLDGIMLGISTTNASGAATLTYAIASDNKINAGNHTINVRFTGNYLHHSSSCDSILNVLKAPLWVNAVSTAISHGLPIPAFSAEYNGFVFGEGPTDLNGVLLLETTATSSSPPGTYTITPSGLISSNYNIGFISGILKIFGPASNTGLFVYPVTVNADYDGNIIDNSLSITALLTLPTFAGQFIGVYEGRIIKFYLYFYTSGGRVDTYLGTATTDDSGVVRFTCPITSMKEMLKTSINTRICAVFTGYTFMSSSSHVIYTCDPRSYDEPVTISRQEPPPGISAEDETAGWKTYINDEYGFEFKYPQGLQTRNTFEPYNHLGNQWRVEVSGDTNGKPIVSIVVYRIENDSTYPRYFDAELRIGVSSDPQDLASCGNPDQTEAAAVPPVEVINGITFKKLIIQDAAMMQYIEGISYRTVHNGMCFAVEQLKTGSNYRDESSSEDIPDAVLDSYYNSISDIIKTFKFTK
jgi:hypothetical protein